MSSFRDPRSSNRRHPRHGYDVCGNTNSKTATRNPQPLPLREDGRVVHSIPPRDTLMRAQTPQAFRLPLIARAYTLALQDPALQATDDCGILHRYLPTKPIHIVAGEETNRKITFKEDL
ncbi:MAG: 2-C-methyl-D-erythritol 4-phosphate cytidylyltransferase [Paludibacteraceae bacterium]|nr:2-C-methyl-D-erythritol 4-phosphate cytidylyltransferase [Paludibacteraceae bacterium]